MRLSVPLAASRAGDLFIGSKVYIAKCLFFFQAEDGIRDIGVTGVQTCALPISGELAQPQDADQADQRRRQAGEPTPPEIGRASCREREQNSVVYAPRKKQR